MKSKKLIGKIIIVLVLITLILLVLLIIKDDKNNSNKYENDKVTNENIEQNSKELKKVKSATAFFTVQSCINKYITYVSEQDSDSVYKILDNEYIKEYSVTNKNSLDNIDNISTQTVFEATEMKEEEIDENNHKYYVTGILKEDARIGNTILNSSFKIIVVLNFEDMIFSVIPVKDGGTF